MVLNIHTHQNNLMKPESNSPIKCLIISEKVNCTIENEKHETLFFYFWQPKDRTYWPLLTDYLPHPVL